MEILSQLIVSFQRIDAFLKIKEKDHFEQNVSKMKKGTILVDISSCGWFVRHQETNNARSSFLQKLKFIQIGKTREIELKHLITLKNIK